MSGTRQSGGRKSTASRSRSTRKKNTGARKPAVMQENDLWEEVRLVVLLIVSGLLFFSNLGFGGKVGGAMSGFLFGCMGLFAYIFPVVMLVLLLFSLANRENLIAAIKIFGAVLGSVATVALLHLFTMSGSDAYGWKEIYDYCAEHRTGGGLIGGLISGVLKDAFGLVGAYLVLLGILIICVVIVTERSFVKGMSKGSQKVYESARQDMERRREAAVLRREQRSEKKKEQRLEKRVSGVSSDLKIQKQQEGGLREITAEGAEDVFTDGAPLFEETDDREPKMAIVHKAQAKNRPEYSGTDRAEEPEEIPFDEEDLLKNALSRKELEAKQAREKERIAAASSVGTNLEEEHREPVPEECGDTVPAHGPGQTSAAEYQYPPISLLKPPKRERGKKDTSIQLQETARHLQQIMEDFGVNAAVTDVSQGPAVTRFEVQPAHGVKVSKIIALADDIKLNLAVADIRMEAPIPGKAAVGIEVPNKENSTVMLRELLESGEFRRHSSKIAFAVGKDIGGNSMVTDIAKMPHLLIAGATGSGKSVCINTLIMSILYKARPDEVKLIMIDPKVVELSTYNGIPHLLIPVVTDPKKAAGALNWAVTEMMGRYNKFAEVNVRNIEGYNSKIDSIAAIEDDHKPEKMPQIVIIVDELADLMMVSPGEVEDAICRLAQLARAAGIHLIIATQRPSVNVITGLIKANMPSRIAFAVSSGVDSRTILDMNGAEKLLGKGDMLFSPYGLPKPLRVQGAFVSDAEVSAVVEFLSSQCSSTGAEQQINEQMKQMQAAVESAALPDAGGGSDKDALFAEAGKFLIEKDKASIGMLQRWFKVGFNRAARIMDQLAEAGVVGEEEGTKPRKILMSMEEFEQYIEECL